MSTKNVDKRKLKKVLQIAKLCLWCEKLMDIGNRSPAQYNKVTVHKQCVTSWTHYKVSKKESELLADRGDVRCSACNATLHRREGEPLQAWLKRENCNKSCAAKKHSVNRVVVKQAVETMTSDEERRLHLKRYIPGTTEFERLAQHYLERGL
jgi:hypothetical protein